MRSLAGSHETPQDLIAVRLPPSNDQQNSYAGYILAAERRPQKRRKQGTRLSAAYLRFEMAIRRTSLTRFRQTEAATNFWPEDAVRSAKARSCLIRYRQSAKSNSTEKPEKTAWVTHFEMLCLKLASEWRTLLRIRGILLTAGAQRKTARQGPLKASSFPYRAVNFIFCHRRVAIIWLYCEQIRIRVRG